MSNMQPNTLLRRARLSKRWTQAELAAHLDVTTISVGRWERGEVLPTRHTIQELSQLFEMSPSALGFFAETTPQEALPAERSPSIDPMIPIPPSLFIGREEILSSLHRQFQQKHPVIALYGLPGIGKTALAATLAMEHKQFFDGILWVGLGPDPTLDRELARWEILLRRSQTDSTTIRSREEWLMALRMAIGARRMLLVIDDAWNINDALLFKVGGNNCVHVLTTRFPNIAMQFAHDGEPVVVKELDEQKSMNLLVRLAPKMDASNADVQALVQSVNGHPLALTLIGKYLHMQEWTQHPRHVHSALVRLRNTEERLLLSQPLSPRERSSNTPAYVSLQATIEVSEQYLPESSRHALRVLTIFPPKPNSFSEEAALAVAACSVEALDRLLEAGLLEVWGAGRYCLHQVIADYAQLQMHDETAFERFIEYYVRYMETSSTIYEALEREAINLFAFLEIAYKMGKRQDFVRGICAFAPFLLLRGLYDLAEYNLQRAREVPESREREIQISLFQGQMAQKRGNYAAAVDFFQEGLKGARLHDSPEWISALLADLGWVTWKQGRYMQAEELLREGVGLARQIGNNERISKFLRLLGSVYSSLGDYVQAIGYFREGLDVARQVGNDEQVCVLLIDLGVSFSENDNPLQAEVHVREGLSLARQLRHREWISLALVNLSDFVISQQRYAQAQEYSEEGLALARQIGHLEWIIGHLINLGITARELNEYRKAETFFQEAVELARKLSGPYIAFMSLYEYGYLALKQGQAETADTLFQECQRILPEGDRALEGFLQMGVSRLAMLRGKREEAIHLGQASQATFVAIGSRHALQAEQWLATIASLSQ